MVHIKQMSYPILWHDRMPGEHCRRRGTWAQIYYDPEEASCSCAHEWTDRGAAADRYCCIHPKSKMSTFSYTSN